MPIPAPPHCQSCMDPCGPWQDGGVEVQDGSNFWICDACWNKMSVFERAKLRLEVKELSRIEDMTTAMDAIRRLREEEQNRGEEWRNGSDD